MSTHVPGFQSFSGGFFLHHFVLAKLATSSIRVIVFHCIEVAVEEDGCNNIVPRQSS